MLIAAAAGVVRGRGAEAGGRERHWYLPAPPRNSRPGASTRHGELRGRRAVAEEPLPDDALRRWG